MSEAVEIGPGTGDDLPGIVAILNDAIANSDATLSTEPVSVPERRDWFGQFSAAGPYRLVVGLAAEPVHVALAGIVLPNDASVALHRKLGFTEVGTFREYAVKNGRYLNSLWMQRIPAG